MILAKIIASGLLILITGNAAVAAGRDGVITGPGNGWSGVTTIAVGVVVGIVIWVT